MIDINCDIGEGASNDAELMTLITSANIACGAHAGNIDTMRSTVKLAKAHNIAIGAHPGYADRANFGRIVVPMLPAEITRLITQQIRDLMDVCRAHDAKMVHVKPHGALYNAAAKDRTVADAIAHAVLGISPNLILVGLSGSELIHAGQRFGLNVLNEVFADRTYQPDGSLTPRTQPCALIHNPADSCKQVLMMIQNNCVIATDGTRVPITADTLCIHGDGAQAVSIARQLITAIRGA